MSIWSEVSGCVALRNDSHFSLKKYTAGLFDEYDLRVEQENTLNSIMVKFNLTFCGDGLDAAKLVDAWIAGIPGDVDCSATIRWLT